VARRKETWGTRVQKKKKQHMGSDHHREKNHQQGGGSDETSEKGADRLKGNLTKNWTGRLLAGGQTTRKGFTEGGGVRKGGPC